MHGHDHFGFLCDLLLDILGIEGERIVNVCKHRSTSRSYDRAGARNPGVRGKDYLISRLDVEAHQSGVQSGRSRSERKCVLCSNILPEFFFELARDVQKVRAVKAVRGLGLQHLEYGVCFFIVEIGRARMHDGECIFSYGLAAVQSQRILGR